LKRLLLIMYRKLMSDAMVSALSESAEFELFVEHNYANAVGAALTYMPSIALVEIPENRGALVSDYLEICAAIRRAVPRCKLMLMCPENSEESKHAAVDAMSKGAIDDFIYYNVSMDYLLSKLAVSSTCQQQFLEVN